MFKQNIYKHTILKNIYKQTDKHTIKQSQTHIQKQKNKNVN